MNEHGHSISFYGRLSIVNIVCMPILKFQFFKNYICIADAYEGTLV